MNFEQFVVGGLVVFGLVHLWRNYSSFSLTITLPSKQETSNGSLIPVHEDAILTTQAELYTQAVIKGDDDAFLQLKTKNNEALVSPSSV